MQLWQQHKVTYVNSFYTVIKIYIGLPKMKQLMTGELLVNMTEQEYSKAI